MRDAQNGDVIGNGTRRRPMFRRAGRLRVKSAVN